MKNKTIFISSFISLMCFFAILISSFVLLSININADSVIDEVSVRVPVACSMQVDSESTAPHHASVKNGLYRKDIGITTVKAFCNDIEGLSIYAVGFTDEEVGKNVLASTSLGASRDIITGAAESGDVSNWAMKLGADASAEYGIEVVNGFDNYSAVPAEFTKVATRESGTDVGNLASGATFTTTYAVYISKGQPADTYAGKVKYIMLHPASEEPPHAIDTAPGLVGYYPNTSTAVGIMANQAISDADTSIALTAPQFSREGYGFAGWNDKYDYSGNFYGPNEIINIAAGQYSGDNKGLSLYAVWVESEGELQNWNGCPAMTVGQIKALTDNRDNETYAVAKLTDNSCWMIENLKIDNSASRDLVISGSQRIGQGFAGLPASSDSWSSDATAFQLNNNNKSLHNSYGNYYSWATAIASNEVISNNNSDVETSICPSGWRLPLAGQINAKPYGDYLQLLQYISNENPNQSVIGGYDYYNGENYSKIIRQYPNNFVFSGGWSSTSSDSQGESGYYWSATTSSLNSAYYLYFNNSMVRPGNGYGSKYNGYSIRCVTSN